MLPSFLVPMLCHLYIVRRGDTILHLTLLPTGTCFYCCPIQLNRDVQFLLYTRRNPTYPNVLDFNDVTTLRKSNFNDKHPTIIYIHGYSDSSSGKGPTSIRNAYLRRGHYNVILINWPKLAVLPWYITAVRNAKVVGPYLAHMISWLDAQKAVPLSKIHVIGFSLGAEVAGFMGKALAPRKIGRITGLDPAYPLYMNTGEDGHLTWADAAFVDVIHTDGGNFGFPNPLGHVDFYPNGGVRRQPGCDLKSIVRMGFRKFINQYITCGHNRAWRYYAESVENPYGFPASRCSKWRPGILANCVWKPEAYMGYAADTKYRGKFYLSTNARSPYAMNLTSHKLSK
ncbi:PREDICTED: pancreatic lipase-related protein 2 [Trachymyrmex septentrionalis]|uniref:pancreatic lipase-related protein 2 n=1 Tax=Trachymyrmex septentrionalis TaxID=34720 RepID=UPI00084EDF9E|nr:PREDICTED: pancreatic lipase-related protein 2 [Trachymyrmex septentrionalis]